MLSFVLRRLLAMVAVLLVLVAALFALQRISPINEVRVAVGPNASREVVEATRERLGYNDPLPAQYLRYIGDVATGDLQVSLRTGQSVSSDLRGALPATIELVLAAFLLAAPIALLFGIAGAARSRGAGALRGSTMVLASAPPFVLGIFGILIFYKQLGWLPATNRTSIPDPPTGPTGLLTVDSLVAARFDVFADAVRHLVMPAICLAIVPAVAVGRVLRGAILTNLRADHVQVARAKGLSELGVLTRHCLRNSAGPTLAMTGLMTGVVFAGVVVVEKVFAWPGIGLYITQSIPRGDFPAIAGTTLLLGAAYIVVNAIVDVLQAVADPRITA
jgi:peptide/nickel transport system permease protein